MTQVVGRDDGDARRREGDGFPSPLSVRESADGRGFATRSIASELPSTMTPAIASQIKIFTSHEYDEMGRPETGRYTVERMYRQRHFL
jgi:hypothetical protein